MHFIRVVVSASVIIRDQFNQLKMYLHFHKKHPLRVSQFSIWLSTGHRSLATNDKKHGFTPGGRAQARGGAAVREKQSQGLHTLVITGEKRREKSHTTCDKGKGISSKWTQFFEFVEVMPLKKVVGRNPFNLPKLYGLGLIDVFSLIQSSGTKLLNLI